MKINLFEIFYILYNILNFTYSERGGVWSVSQRVTTRQSQILVITVGSAIKIQNATYPENVSFS